MYRLSIAGLFIALHSLGAQAPAQAPAPLTRDERNHIAAQSARVLDSLYVDRAVGKAMSSLLREGTRTGRWDRLTSPGEFADTLTAQLRAISHDLHVHLTFDPVDPRLVENVTPEEKLRRRNEILEDIADENYGFPEVRILPGNVGLLRMDNFVVPRLAATSLAAAMTLLNHTRGLIIDFRENGGGHEDQLTLMMSYFLAEPVKIGESFTRPDSTITQTWTYAAVPGPRYDAAKPVFVLLSKETFSAAEGMAVGLRQWRKATLVGDTTGGGGHQGDYQPVGERFMLFVPSGSSTGGNEVEGRGVRPDVAVPAARALEEAHRLALRAILPTIKDSTRHRAFEQFLVEAEARAAKAKP